MNKEKKTLADSQIQRTKVVIAHRLWGTGETGEGD